MFAYNTGSSCRRVGACLEFFRAIHEHPCCGQRRLIRLELGMRQLHLSRHSGMCTGKCDVILMWDFFQQGRAGKEYTENLYRYTVKLTPSRWWLHIFTTDVVKMAQRVISGPFSLCTIRPPEPVTLLQQSDYYHRTLRACGPLLGRTGPSDSGQTDSGNASFLIMYSAALSSSCVCGWTCVRAELDLSQCGRGCFSSEQLQAAGFPQFLRMTHVELIFLSF